VGFVQQQQVGFVDQGAGQRDALAGAAGQAGNLRVRGQAQLFEHRAHARRALPVFVVVAQVADDVKDGGVLVELGFLFDRGHAQARRAGDIAVVGQGAAIEQAEQRGLAGAVAADEADALAGLDGEVGVVQQRVVAIGQLDVGQGDERCEGHVVVVSAASRRIKRYCRRNPAGSFGPSGGQARNLY